MTSPCKDCKRRKVGCHNVKTCKAWAKYVASKEKRKAQKDTGYTAQDWENHLRRRKRLIKTR